MRQEVGPRGRGTVGSHVPAWCPGAALGSPDAPDGKSQSPSIRATAWQMAPPRGPWGEAELDPGGGDRDPAPGRCRSPRSRAVTDGNETPDIDGVHFSPAPPRPPRARQAAANPSSTLHGLGNGVIDHSLWSQQTGSRALRVTSSDPSQDGPAPDEAATALDLTGVFRLLSPAGWTGRTHPKGEGTMLPDGCGGAPNPHTPCPYPVSGVAKQAEHALCWTAYALGP